MMMSKGVSALGGCRTASSKGRAMTVWVRLRSICSPLVTCITSIPEEQPRARPERVSECKLLSAREIQPADCFEPNGRARRGRGEFAKSLYRRKRQRRTIRGGTRSSASHLVFNNVTWVLERTTYDVTRTTRSVRTSDAPAETVSRAFGCDDFGTLFRRL